MGKRMASELVNQKSSNTTLKKIHIFQHQISDTSKSHIDAKVMNLVLL